MSDYTCKHGRIAMGRDCPECHSRSTTENLIAALSNIARDIHDPQGTTIAAILEARDRLEEARLLLKETRSHIPTPKRHDTPYGRYVLAVHQFFESKEPNAKISGPADKNPSEAEPTIVAGSTASPCSTAFSVAEGTP